ncbi:MAG: putative Nucleoside diphosphate kinase [Parcubacteria group bacterium]|nr:putative Nucleoside diphosphate kinase [Parcubacteria group bacterium]
MLYSIHMAIPHPKTERTFVIIKPDGIQRGLVGEIIKRFERTGLKLVAMKMTVADKERIWKHYNKDDAWFIKKGTNIAAERAAAGLSAEKEPIEYGKDIIRALEKYMTCSPSVMMVWEGNQAVTVVKKLTGTTEPATSDVGTIRGDFTTDSYGIAAVDDRAVRNLIHCTEFPEEAEGEITLWFTPEELISYRQISEAMLYDVNLDGILE